MKKSVNGQKSVPVKSCKKENIQGWNFFKIDIQET